MLPGSSGLHPGQGDLGGWSWSLDDALELPWFSVDMCVDWGQQGGVQEAVCFLRRG